MTIFHAGFGTLGCHSRSSYGRTSIFVPGEAAIVETALARINLASYGRHADCHYGHRYEKDRQPSEFERCIQLKNRRRNQNGRLRLRTCDVRSAMDHWITSRLRLWPA